MTATGSDESVAVRIRLLVQGVEVPARTPDDQVRYIGTMHPDELGLTFDDGYQVVAALQADGLSFDEDALRLLSEIDQRLSAMSGSPNERLWTEAAIRSDASWQELRQCAREVLPKLPHP